MLCSQWPHPDCGSQRAPRPPAPLRAIPWRARANARSPADDIVARVGATCQHLAASPPVLPTMRPRRPSACQADDHAMARNDNPVIFDLLTSVETWPYPPQEKIEDLDRRIGRDGPHQPKTTSGDDGRHGRGGGPADPWRQSRWVVPPGCWHGLAVPSTFGPALDPDCAEAGENVHGGQNLAQVLSGTAIRPTSYRRQSVAKFISGLSDGTETSHTVTDMTRTICRRRKVE